MLVGDQTSKEKILMDEDKIVEELTEILREKPHVPGIQATCEDPEFDSTDAG